VGRNKAPLQANLAELTLISVDTGGFCRSNRLTKRLMTKKSWPPHDVFHLFVINFFVIMDVADNFFVINFFVINFVPKSRPIEMPIKIHAETRRMAQEEFGRIAYDVMKCVFGLHNEMGRFFHEDVYREGILRRLPAAKKQVQIEVRFLDFRKDYFMDLVVHGGAVFELKAVEKLTDQHRSQLMNYLLLAELQHGKLINLRPDLVEHEFVNALLTREQRTDFVVCDAEWEDLGHWRPDLKDLVTQMLRDWGIGLDLRLYEEALTHFLGGEEQVWRDIETVLDGRVIGRQKVHLAGVKDAFKFTAIPADAMKRFEDHAQRFLRHTRLRSISWINVTREVVTFKVIKT
jgi:GxxExxY protein